MPVVPDSASFSRAARFIDRNVPFSCHWADVVGAQHGGVVATKEHRCCQCQERRATAIRGDEINQLGYAVPRWFGVFMEVFVFL